VRWEGRPRALLGGFSDAEPEDASDDEDEDEEDARSALSGGPSSPHLECDDILDLAAAASSGPERWDVLGLGQAMVRTPFLPSLHSEYVDGHNRMRFISVVLVPICQEPVSCS
jgi:hypothetical protein